MKIAVASTYARLLAQEDTDYDGRITIDDRGPKRFVITDAAGGQLKITGTYALSNLLQLLAEARDRGQEFVELASEQLTENPVDRTSRRIHEKYWRSLARRLDRDSLAGALVDPKTGNAKNQPLYIPHADQTAFNYFYKLSNELPGKSFQAVQLPAQLTPEFVHALNARPGLLSLRMREDAAGVLRGVPFIVPGGRFNEMYGWDSYFMILGLLADGLVDLACDVVENLVYEIEHYGKILNANRSYYLTRSSPPFLTSAAIAVYHHLPKTSESKSWLAHVLRAAIKEYTFYWHDRHHRTKTGLNRYFGAGIGLPPETEPGHFDAVLAPFAKRAGLSVQTFEAKYRRRAVRESELDAYFVHDRAVRESGHDTSYRLEGRCAHLNTVDQNALLYKIEMDLADTISTVFDDALELADGSFTKSFWWRERANQRRTRMDRFLWDEAAGMYFDYDFEGGARTGYESATTLYPLWAGCASDIQAERLVQDALPILEEPGGIVTSTERSRGALSAERPMRQWDYPIGWAPHQMIAWQGLLNYGYTDIAHRLIHRWLSMIAEQVRDYNGVIVEKYDVVQHSHKVQAEYGNVGTDFSGYPSEGFGWTNASFQVGLALLPEAKKQALRVDVG